MAQFDTMVAAEPYLYFRSAADNDILVQAKKLTSVKATSGTNIRMTFTGNDYAQADNCDDGTWSTKRHVYVNLTHAGGANFEKDFMKKLVSAINSPITVGDPNSTYDRGFIVIFDAVDTGANFTGITACAATTDG